jgi:hypothetical protein
VEFVTRSGSILFVQMSECFPVPKARANLTKWSKLRISRQTKSQTQTPSRNILIVTFHSTYFRAPKIGGHDVQVEQEFYNQPSSPLGSDQMPKAQIRVVTDSALEKHFVRGVSMY